MYDVTIIINIFYEYFIIEFISRLYSVLCTVKRTSSSLNKYSPLNIGP